MDTGLVGDLKDRAQGSHRIPVEEVKSALERGHYIHPDLFDQLEEKSVEWARTRR